MAPAQLRAGAGWVHVRPLRQPSPPGNQPATLLIRPNPQGGSSSLPMIGRRLPASSSFVLARAGRRGLRALQLDPARATAQPAATRKSHKTVPPRNPAAASGGHRVRPPRPLDNRGLHGCGYYRTSSPVTALPMIMRWISDVPSKIVKIVDARAVYAGRWRDAGAEPAPIQHGDPSGSCACWRTRRRHDRHHRA